MNNLIVTVVDPRVRGAIHHASIHECKVLIGRVNGEEVLYYIAEESEVDHECIGTPKKMLYDRLKRVSGGVNVELAKVAEKVVDFYGIKKEINYKVLRIV